MAEKSMAIAMILSFIIAGLGIIYVGDDVRKGLIILGAVIVCNIISTFVFFFIVVPIIIWAYGLYLTYQEVNAHNGF